MVIYGLGQKHRWYCSPFLARFRCIVRVYGAPTQEDKAGGGGRRGREGRRLRSGDVSEKVWSCFFPSPFIGCLFSDARGQPTPFDDLSEEEKFRAEVLVQSHFSFDSLSPVSLPFLFFVFFSFFLFPSY